MKTVVVGILALFTLSIDMNRNVQAGPIAGAACCVASCAPGGGPLSPIYWACTGACTASAGAVNPFAPGFCIAAFAAPTP